MAFVIVSPGALAGSKLHTVRATTLACIAAGLGLALLASGAALGFSLAQRLLAAGNDAGQAAGLRLDPAAPGQRAVIDRVGAMSGRLLQLEGETERLAHRLGVITQDAPTAFPDPDPGIGQVPRSGVADPSGGPLVAPLPPAAGRLGGHLAEDLARLDRELDRLEAHLAVVSEASTLRDLDRMAVPSRSPIAGGRISSGFGNRLDPFTEHLARHTGVDMPAPYGTPITASAGGRVSFAGLHGPYGWMVEIDHGKGLVTRYGHLSKMLVRPGDVVLPGQAIAAVGSSGRSTGPHLHFEVLRLGVPVEPRFYLASRGG
jgi:murein DD-endopeptidase MepM/ murein hydrolase activator NlpD